MNPRLRARSLALPWALVLSLLLLVGCRSAEPAELIELVRSPAGPFLAGVGSAEFTPPKGYGLGGYGGGARRDEFPFLFGGGWPGQFALWAHQAWHAEGQPASDMLHRARGVSDPLLARALVLRPAAGPPLAMVRIDAIGVTRELHAQAAQKLAGLGYRPSGLLLCATHTHSGPGHFFRPAVARVAAMDTFRVEIEAAIVGAIVRAVAEAHTRARPARLGFGQARDRDSQGKPVLARNRRSGRSGGAISPDAIDDRIELLWVETAPEREPLALVVNMAIHPTVLGSDNLHYSADVAGAIEGALAERIGAPVLFFNGAEGDIGPRRIKAFGGLARCRELGQAAADLIAPALTTIRTSETLEVEAALARKELGDPRAIFALGRERFLDAEQGWLGWLGEPFVLPLNLVLWTAGLTHLRVALTWNALGVVAHLGPYFERTETLLGAWRLSSGSGAQRERALFVGLPGEPTHDLGLVLKARSQALGAERAWVLGLCQDHVGYIASEREYRRGGYEAWGTLFGPRTGPELREGAEALLQALSSAAKGR